MSVDSRTVAVCFALSGTPTAVRPLGTGRIHDTYEVVVRTEGGRTRRFVLQRINRVVFANPLDVIRNVQRVATHIRGKVRAVGGDLTREALTLIPTKGGTLFHRDKDGEIWRAYVRIDNATGHSRIRDVRHAFEVGRAFGRLLHQLSDLPLGAVAETIPSFHDTPKRLSALLEAAARDPRGRARRARDEIRFVEAREDETAGIVDLLKSNDVPERLVHNDTKIDNVLLDDETGAAICVLDLDTVMPGTALYDIGDCARSALTRPSSGGEGGRLTAADLRVFEAVVTGYLTGAGGLLTPAEVEAFPAAVRTITLECGIRLLADHLEGDVYFRTCRPGQNLERCRVQLELVRRLEGSWEQMAETVVRCANLP